MSKKILLTLLFVFATIISNADNFIKREVRSVWLTTVWALDWPSEQGTSATVRASQQAEMIKYLDQLQADNFNVVYFQVRSMCDAFYKSSYEPWSSYLTGSRGSNPGWDPLTFVVEECHKRGMECHAWVNPYRFSTGANWTTGQDNELKKSGWLLTHESTTILNPGIPRQKKESLTFAVKSLQTMMLTVSCSTTISTQTEYRATAMLVIINFGKIQAQDLV